MQMQQDMNLLQSRNCRNRGNDRMEMWSWLAIIFSGVILGELLFVNICCQPTKVKLKENTEEKQNMGYVKKDEF